LIGSHLPPLVAFSSPSIFIEMGLNLSDLTPVHDKFYGVIPGQSSTPIGCINLEVSYGTGDDKCKEMLTFEVASFDIGYNCIRGRPLLLKFVAVIHTAYATLKIPSPKGIITIKADQRDALACENASFSQVGCFGTEAAQKQLAKVAKTQGGSTLLKTSMPKPPIISTPRPPSTKKGTDVASPSNQQPTINRWMKRRKGLMTKRSQSTPATRTRSSGSAQAWIPNRNLCSSLFSEKS
jgi:hypothetical protein